MGAGGQAAVHHGGCLCGAVRYRLTGPLRAVINCHCSQCRRFHGHYGAYTTLAQANFALTRQDGLGWYAASPTAERGFCTRCGSSLFWRPVGRDNISVAAGTLDAPTGLETVGDIFVADKGDYYVIDGDRPSRPQGGGDALADEIRALKSGA
ncbi:MAG: GFA family protein [Alphaproteobacteria bacterium]